MKKEDSLTKLTVIIPYYKTYNETNKLLKNLEKQLTDEVEVFLIDDGCQEKRLDEHKKINIIHLEENKGLSYARNQGIKRAKGTHIVFIDSDDNISDDYIETIINKINTSEFDYCYFSWKAINNGMTVKIKDEPPGWNLAVWKAVYKREYVELFDENVRYCEDVPWQIKMREKKGKKEIINKILYYYNDGRPGSLTSTKGKGE